MCSFRRIALIVATVVGVLAAPTITHADEGQTYTVAAGDTLFGIANSAGVRLSDLLRANDMTITSLILPGQRLTVPSTGSPASSSTGTSAPSADQSGATYTVTWGDTLSGIAARHRISLRSLLAANDMTVTSLIVPGQRLTVPGDTSTTPAMPAPAPSSSPSAPAGSSDAHHVVAWGDTLSGIAAYYGVSLRSLLDANDMTIASLIVPEMRLSLPGHATTTSAGSPASTGNQTVATSGIAAVVDYALAQVGKPYRFFASGPDAFDCSGLTLAAYRQIGTDLVHYSGSQSRQGTDVDFRNEPIRPGDLIFQARRGSERINHVGMAITSTTWIQAVGTGHPVRVGPMPSTSSIAAVRRFVTAD